MNKLYLVRDKKPCLDRLSLSNESESTQIFEGSQLAEPIVEAKVKELGKNGRKYGYMVVLVATQSEMSAIAPVILNNVEIVNG